MTGTTRSTDAREHPEEALVLTIDLSRAAVAALVVVAIVITAALLVRGPASASAAGEAVSAATDSMRQYYLLNETVADATQAIGSCAQGYHFASMWEILDSSNLVYNTSEGASSDDSGSGPPTTWYGWVRTGYISQNNATPGQANCNLWTTTSGYGTTVRLVSEWATGGELHVWDAGIGDCDAPRRVWCVED